MRKLFKVEDEMKKVLKVENEGKAPVVEQESEEDDISKSSEPEHSEIIFPGTISR